MRKLEVNQNFGQMARISFIMQMAVTLEQAFEGVSNPVYLDEWWTKKCKGKPALKESYELYFSPEHIWKAEVTKCDPPHAFELTLIEAHEDWLATRVGFKLRPQGDGISMEFYHDQWKEENEHYKISCYCWPVYMRTLKYYLERGVRVPYEQRLD